MYKNQAIRIQVEIKAIDADQYEMSPKAEDAFLINGKQIRFLFFRTGSCLATIIQPLEDKIEA